MKRVLNWILFLLSFGGPIAEEARRAGLIK